MASLGDDGDECEEERREEASGNGRDLSQDNKGAGVGEDMIARTLTKTAARGKRKVVETGKGRSRGGFLNAGEAMLEGYVCIGSYLGGRCAEVPEKPGANIPHTAVPLECAREKH